MAMSTCKQKFNLLTPTMSPIHFNFSMNEQHIVNYLYTHDVYLQVEYRQPSLEHQEGLASRGMSTCLPLLCHDSAFTLASYLLSRHAISAVIRLAQ